MFLGECIKNCYRFFGILILLCFSIAHSKSQQNIKFKRIGEDTGISNNWVRCIFQDNEGYIWFGTADGINRYDAYECKSFRPKNQQGIDYVGIHVNDIKTKSKNELWVASISKMYVFSDNVLNVYRELPTLEYYGIVSVNNTYSWVLSSEGLIYLNTSSGKYTNVSKKPNHPTHGFKLISYFKDSLGNIWFGSTGAIFKFSSIDNNFEIFTDFEGLDKQTKNDIGSLAEDKDGKIWAGFGQNGLYCYDSCSSDKKFKKHSNGAIAKVIVDAENILWVAKGSGQGLLKMDLNTGATETYFHNTSNPNTISDSSVYSLFEDKLGDLWVGTYGAGLNYYSKRSKKIFTVKEEDPDCYFKSNLINTITEDATYLWIGNEAGLDRIHKLTNEFKHYQYKEGDPKSLRRNSVQTLYYDSFGNLWIGTWEGGLLKYNSKTDDFKRYELVDEDTGLKLDKVVEIKQGADHRLWIGTHEGGIFEYDYETDSLQSRFRSKTNPTGVPYLKISSISASDKNEVIFSTYASVNFYNPNTNTYQSFGFRKDDSNLGNILCVFKDSYNQVWVGTNIGLYKLNRQTGSYIPFDLEFNTKNLSVQAITQDDQENIWLSTNQGVFEIDSNDSVTRLTKQDGLTTNDFKRKAVYKSESGFIYFGSSKGLNYFKPKDLVINNNPPNLKITSLSVLKSRPNQSNVYEYVLENFDTEKQIILDKDQSSFEISFTGLNYLDPERNNYKYKLEGYDKVWVDSKNLRTATYTNLNAGNYTFKLTGTNNDKVAARKIKEIQFKKTGPWYLSRWFKFLAIIIAISFPFIFYFIRLSIFRKQQKILKESVAKRTQELTEANAVLTRQTNKILQQNIELSDHRNNLENLVNQRTIQLEKAKIRAEESDLLKSAFIANMSHEIRTPMNAIYGFSGLLDDNDLSDQDRREYINIVKDSCESLLVLIDDILDISIMDAQGIQLNLQQINIHDFLNQLELILKKKEKPQIVLQYENEEPLNDIIVTTDPIRLRQILINLVNNAIKFTEKGSVSFGYYTSKKHIIFYVKDTGIGISKKDLSKIFKPFRKAENNKEKLYRGTGIGLSISERIVSSFKGEIWVESRLGVGSTFYVQLPLILTN